jgi:hypothetical protein
VREQSQPARRCTAISLCDGIKGGEAADGRVQLTAPSIATMYAYSMRVASTSDVCLSSRTCRVTTARRSERDDVDARCKERVLDVM